MNTLYNNEQEKYRRLIGGTNQTIFKSNEQLIESELRLNRDIMVSDCRAVSQSVSLEVGACQENCAVSLLMSIKRGQLNPLMINRVNCWGFENSDIGRFLCSGGRSKK